MVAKNNYGFEYYSSLMENGKITKTYNAIVEGIPENHSGIIDTPIVHHSKNSKKMVIYNEKIKYSGKIKYGKTGYKLIKNYKNYSLVELTITKGIRHQIRVHLSSIGVPIVGDKVYNTKTYEDIENHLLFANKILFTNHENKNTTIEIDVPFLDWQNLF